MTTTTIRPLARYPVIGAFLIAALTSINPAAAQTADCPDKDPAIVSCDFDRSAQADLEALRRQVEEQFAPFAGERFGAGDVEIRYLGKARVGTLPTSADEGGRKPVSEPGSVPPRKLRSDAWRVFIPHTQNEFEIVVPASIRNAIHGLMVQRGQTLPTRGRMGNVGGDSPDMPAAQARRVVTKAFSGGNDSRVRRTDTTTWPWRTIADLGGCTATFIGARHVITAAHCVFSRRTFTWGSNFTVVPGRDASNRPFGSTAEPGVPNVTVFTPAQWRNPSATNPDPFDIAIIVVPDRLGDEVGAMGYGVLSSGELKSRTHLLRGYPFCESETGGSINNPERIDEPSPCTINGFYVGDACTVNTFSRADADGWNRRVTHGCDASAANSGSAVYTYVDFPGVGSVPFVSMVHTTSLKCRFTGDSACTAADTHPLEATRITPEYATWISTIRNMTP